MHKTIPENNLGCCTCKSGGSNGCCLNKCSPVEQRVGDRCHPEHLSVGAWRWSQTLVNTGSTSTSPRTVYFSALYCALTGKRVRQETIFSNKTHTYSMFSSILFFSAVVQCERLWVIKFQWQILFYTLCLLTTISFFLCHNIQ